MSHQDQVAEGVEVSQALRHLLPLNQQEARMHPKVSELLMRHRLRLRDLVFVVWKDQVFAARVDVEALSEVLHAHDRALDVPAGTSRTDHRLPLGLAGFRSLP